MTVEIVMPKHDYLGATLVATAKAGVFGAFALINILALGILGKIYYGDSILSKNAYRRGVQACLRVREILPILTAYHAKIESIEWDIYHLEERILKASSHSLLNHVVSSLDVSRLVSILSDSQ